MADIEKLSISISADASDATTAIDNLCNSLTKLQNTSRGINLSNLKNVSTQLNDFGKELNTFTSSINKFSFASLKNNINKLNEINVGNLSGVSGTLGSLVNPLNQLGNLNFNSTGLSSFINAIKNLAANSANLSAVNLDGIGNQITNICAKLQTVGDVSPKITSFVNALGRLASAGNNASLTAVGLAPLGDELVNFSAKMASMSSVSASIMQFINAIGNLASAGNKTAITASNLDSLAQALTRFFQTMSTAPQVSANTVRMTEAISRLSGQTTKLNIAANAFSRTTGSFKNALSRFTSGMGNSSKQAFSLASAFGKFYATYWLVLRAIKGVGSWINLAGSLQEVQNVVDVSFGDMSSKVEEFSKDSIRQFGMSELAVKQYASRFQAMGKAMGISSEQVATANKRLSELTKGYDANDLSKPYIAMSGSVSDLSLNLTKLTADMASFYNVEQEEVAKALQSGIYGGQTRPLRTYGLDLSEATIKEWAMKNGLDANIKSMTQAEKTMLRYQYVISQTKDVHGDFARTSDSWANQVRILKQSFQQLGTIIGKNLINALKPLLRGLNVALQGVITFAQSISNALGKIFGWKLEVQGGSINEDLDDLSDSGSSAADSLGDVADSAGDAAGSTNDANDAAKEYKKTLMGFDQINKLAEQDKDTSSSGSGGSGSGSGSGGSSGGSTAAEAQLVQESNNLLDQFKSNINNLYELGASIRDALINVMDNIPWEDIYEKARKFGVGLANFLNGLFSNNNEGNNIFKSLGGTIAGAINTALNAADAFASEFNFEQLGKALGSGVNNFLYRMDWELLLTNGKKWGSGLAKQLNGFLTETDWTACGEAIASGLNTAITFVFNFGKTFDATALGTAIGNTINGFFEKFDFSEFAETFNAWGDNFKEALKSAFKTIKWEQVLEGITDFIKDVKLSNVGLTILGFALLTKPLAMGNLLLSAIGTGLANLGSLVWGGITGTFGADGALSLSLGLTANTGTTTVGATLAGIGTKIEAAFGPAGIAVAAVTAAFADLMVNGSNTRDTIVTKIGEIKKSICEKLGDAKDAINGVVDAFKDLSDEAYDFYVNSHLRDAVDLIAELVVNSQLSTVKILIEGIGAAFENAANRISGVLTIWKGMFEILNGIVSLDFSKVKTGLKDIATGTVQSATGESKEDTNNTLNMTANLIGWKKDSSFSDNIGGMAAGFVKYLTPGTWIGEKIGGFIAGLNGKDEGDGAWRTSNVGAFTANLAEKAVSEKAGTGKIGDYKANLTDKSVSEKAGTGKIGDFIAKLGDRELVKNGNSKWWKSTIGSFSANITRTTNGLSTNKKTLSGFNAKVTKKSDAIPAAKKTLTGFVAIVKKATTGVQGVAGTIRFNANGGIFMGRQWQPIQRYASGGIPGGGQMFIARENGAGPELVGKMNGHTSVMNNDQIVASVSSGVYKACVAAMSSINSGTTDVNVTLQGDAARLFTVVRDENNRRVRATRTAQLLV